ncbi:MAG TPA: dihydrolipoamide acetyltransferase family protein [Chloroflexia bacterium]|nr:dihydrolipoamide acetyltransferase family protein [Chloroflexia bacterium]
MADVTMPRLSDTMTEGTIAEWFKKEGDEVKKGDVLLDIETDKATMSQEAYENGVLEKIVVQAGQTVAIGTVIAVIGDGSNVGKGGAQPAATPAAAAPDVAPVSSQANAAAVSPTGATPAAGATPTTSQPQPPAVVPPQTGGAPAQASANGNGRVKASPMARRLAEEFGVSLNTIQGSGPGGRIISDDVKAARGAGAPAQPAPQVPAEPTAAPAWGGAAAAAPTQPAPAAAAPAAPSTATGDYEEVELTRMRQTIARRMTEAKQQVPHIYITSEIDMTEALKWRQTINQALAAEGVKVSVNDLIVKASAKALRKLPSINSGFVDNKIRLYKRVNVAIAVALESGLVTPVIPDADQKSVSQIAQEAKSLAEKARTGKLAPSAYDGGTFTISNLGMYDVDSFMAVINQPQSAILAVGSSKPTVIVKGEGPDGQPEFGVIQSMKVTISVDHRSADGASAAQFLQELKRLLENPMLLLV